jgi:hypothetical protein
MPNASSPEQDTEYHKTTAFEWTERAFHLLDRQQLAVTPTVLAGVRSVEVAGPCPRCDHHLIDRQVGVAVTGLGAGTRGTVRGPSSVQEDDPPSTMVVDVTCGCGNTHAGAPESVTGCGVTFRVMMTADDAS